MMHVPPRTSTRRASRLGGFTLVEMLIVMTILGILAMVLVPRYSSSADEARSAAAVEQLRQLRIQVEMYEAHHGRLPPLHLSWSYLTVAANDPRGVRRGPYVSGPPVNPVNNHATVADVGPAGPATSAAGYLYDYASGNGSGTLILTGPDARTPLPGQ